MLVLLCEIVLVSFGGFARLQGFFFPVDFLQGLYRDSPRTGKTTPPQARIYIKKKTNQSHNKLTSLTMSNPTSLTSYSRSHNRTKDNIEPIHESTKRSSMHAFKARKKLHRRHPRRRQRQEYSTRITLRQRHRHRIPSPARPPRTPRGIHHRHYRIHSPARPPRRGTFPRGISDREPLPRPRP